MKHPHPVSFLDPSLPQGATWLGRPFGFWGVDFEGKKVLLITEDITIKTDTTTTPWPINYQIVKAWKKACEDRGSNHSTQAYDRSGGGIPFGDIISVVWSPLVNRR